MNRLVFAGLLSFAVAVVCGPATIRFLRRLKAGQPIRESGPKSHQAKAGTPTMGGLLIVLGAVVATLLFSTPKNPATVVLLTATVGFGLIGLLDDLFKVIGKRSLGLKARSKLALQVLIAGFVALFAYQSEGVGTGVIIPFLKEVVHLSPPVYFLLAIGTIVATANAVNITDGLDGLAAGSTAIAATIFAVIAWRLGAPDAAVFAAAIAGACFGFSWFNAHPAAVIMGDTGSMALGSALGSLAVLTRTELVLVIVGGLFVIETLSVMIQVPYFRLTKGRRLFKMSPLHHHFELSGWAETQVVTRFWLVALGLGVIGLLSV